MADELIDICDEDNNLTGEQRMKSEAHREGLWHRTAHVWVYNLNGELLLQLRANDKALHPGKWDVSAAGHVGAGEEPAISALREMEEEIGIRAEKKALEMARILKSKTVFRDIKNNEFIYVYLLKSDISPERLKLQKEEVQDARFLPLAQIEHELRETPERYVSVNISYWFEMIGAIRKKLSR